MILGWDVLDWKACDAQKIIENKKYILRIKRGS